MQHLPYCILLPDLEIEMKTKEGKKWFFFYISLDVDGKVLVCRVNRKHARWAPRIDFYRFAYVYICVARTQTHVWKWKRSFLQLLKALMVKLGWRVNANNELYCFDCDRLLDTLKMLWHAQCAEYAFLPPTKIDEKIIFTYHRI